MDLTPYTTYEFRAFASTSTSTTYGTTNIFTTLATVSPTVLTTQATSITQSTAILNGTITIGSESVITQGFEWTLSNSTTWTMATVGLTGSAITNSLTGLAPNTAYKFRAYAITSSGTIYGLVQNFTTLEILPPNVLTNPATSITENSVTLNGTISAGTQAIISQGFEWRVSNTNIWMPITVIGNAINHNLIGLTPNTSYEFRAYVTTASGYVYGTIQSFTTLSIVPPTVITNEAIPTSGRSVTLSAIITNGTEVIIAQGFEWKEAGASLWTSMDATLVGSIMTYDLTDLTPNMSYRFRAGALTESGITYGITQSFTTLGLNEVGVSEISVKMYPNPATSQTNLVINGISGDTKIILSDVQGRVLKTIDAKPLSGVLEQTLDLSDLVEGVYYIRIQNTDINRTQKLIVK